MYICELIISGDQLQHASNVFEWCHSNNISYQTGTMWGRCNPETMVIQCAQEYKFSNQQDAILFTLKFG